MSKCRQQQYYGRCSGTRPSQSSMQGEMPYKGMAPAGTMLECDCECDCTLTKMPAGSYPSMGGMQNSYQRGYMDNSACGCGQGRRCYVTNNMPDFSLAMAYVPWQPFQNVYEDAEAHDIGTIFADLNLDFYGRRCN